MTGNSRMIVAAVAGCLVGWCANAQLVQGQAAAQKATPVLGTLSHISFAVADVEKTTKRYLDWWRGAGAEQIAAVVVDVERGEVLSWVGSTGYFQTGTGAIDFALTQRSPGSALKPFIYALALDRDRLGRFTTQVAELQCQLVVTALSADLDPLGPPHRAFHVEQGQVQIV